MDHLEWTVHELDEIEARIQRVRRVKAWLRRWTWVPFGILGVLLIAALILRLEG